MKKFIHRIGSVFLLTGLLAGCAGTPADKSSTDITSTSSAAVSETIENTEKTAWPKTYTDAKGHEVTLDKQPEKVVTAFHAMFADYLYAFDTYPAGAAAADTLLNRWAAYQPYTSKEPAVDIGASNSLNLEKILELEPDLILTMSMHEEVYDDLSKIAPTVMIDYEKINLDWRYGVREFAKLLEKEDQAEAVIEKVEKSIQDGANALKEFREKDESVVFISMTQKNIWPYTVQQLSVIYDEKTGLGLKVPGEYASVTDRSTALSLEALAEYNPDHIFLLTDYGDETAQQWLEELKSNSVWSSISAVQKDNLYKTDRSIFAFNSPIATEYGVGFVVENLKS